MDQETISQRLGNAFEETFIEELIPGILHNFANPLNGIMGRAQLLQRRLNDTVAKLEQQYPEAAETFRESHKKLISDVASICQESDRFYNMFQDVTGKFYTIASHKPERINLSQLLAAELRFADYYLDFKHEIRKEIALEDSVPEITGISAYYSLCFWSLLRRVMHQMQSLTEKNLFVETAHDNSHILIRIRHCSFSPTAEEKRLLEIIQSGDESETVESPFASSSYYLSLRFLNLLGARIVFQNDGMNEETMIKIPY